MIIFGIILLIFLWIIFELFLRGWLFKIIVGGFAWFGMFLFLGMNYPETSHQGATIGDTLIPWCWIIPSVVILLAAGFSREKE